jgi:hypothetical protein
MKKTQLFCLIVIGLAFGFNVASAANYTWTGASSSNSNWSTVANWFNNSTGSISGYPNTTGDAVTIGLGARVPTVDIAISIGSLNINGSTIITLSSTLSVSGAISINSSPTFTGAQLLSSASLSVASSQTLTLNSPLTVSGAISVNSGSIITGTTNSANINGGSLTTNGTFTLSPKAPVTISGLTSVNNGSMTMSNTSLFQTASMNTGNGNTVTVNAPMTVTGTFTVSNASVLTSSSGTAAISLGALTTTNGFTLSAAGPVTVSGATSISNADMTVSTTSLFRTGSLTNNARILTLNAPLTVTGTLSLSGNCTLTGSATALSAGTLTTSGTETISTSGTVSVGGTTTIAGGPTTVSNATSFTTNALTLSGQTLNMNVSCAVTNAITAASGSTLTKNSTGTLTAGSVSSTGSTFTIAAPFTVSGAYTAVSGTNTLSNTSATTSLGSLAVSAGTFNLSTTSIAMNTSVTGATTAASGATFNMSSSGTGSTSTLTTGSLAIAATFNVFNSATISSSGTSNTMSGPINLGNAGYNLTFLGTGTTTITGATGLSETGCALTVGNLSTSTATTVTFGAGTTITLGNNKNGISITNNAKLNFLGTSAAALVTISAPNDPSFTINNYGTITSNYTTITVGANTCTFTNNASAIWNSSNLICNFDASGSVPAILNNIGTFTASALTLDFNSGTSGITNSGTFTANGGSYIRFKATAGTGPNNFITNTRTFNAGTSGSSCIIDILGQNDAITNTGSVSQTATFNLGSTSIINLQGTVAGNVTNSNNIYSVFNLKSDANGSAAFGPVTTGQNLQILGTYNVERFFTGGLSFNNRGYRLLSSPVNQTGNATASSGTYNTVAASYFNISYLKNGAFTGGTGSTASGFSGISIGPTLYLYNETRDTSNETFTSRTHVAITKVNATTVDLADGSTNVSIPIGNGFLFFFVGDATRTTGKSIGGPPQDATTTSTGYINQGTITINLYYGTPGELSRDAPGNAFAKGFCMVGNPYPSTLDLQKVLDDNSKITAIYLLNSRKGGTAQDYVSYTANGSSSPLAQGYAVSGGGFIVKAQSNGHPSLTFNEAQKASTTQPVGNGLIMSAPKAQTLAVDGKFGQNNLTNTQQKLMALPPQTTGQRLTGLYMKLEKDSLLFDYCGIYYGKQWQAAYDDIDAPYLTGYTAKVTMASMTSDGMKAAVNHMPDYTAGSRVKLYINALTSGLYKLKLEGVRNIDTLYNIYLLDHFKKDSLDIRRYGTYAFNLVKTDTSTFGGNRFELVIRRRPVPQYLLTNFVATKVTEGVNINWNTVNESNYTGFTLEKLNKTTGEYAPLYDKQSDGSAAYNYVDHAPNSGSNIYRLKQNDIDNNISYSQPVTIFYDKNAAGSGLFSVFPNPTSEMINVSIPEPTSAATYKFKLYDSMGNLVMQKTSSTSNWSENIGSLKTGAYIVEVIKSNGASLGKGKFIKN